MELIDVNEILMKPKITVSIVLYNNRPEQMDLLIKEFMDFSKRNKNICEAELILTNNASTSSNTKSFLDNFNGIGNIKIINLDKNLGFGAGHNKAFEASKSNYFFVVNPDIIGLNMIDVTTVINYLQEHRDVGMLVPRLHDIQGNLQLTNKCQSTVFDQLIRLLGPHVFKKRQQKFTQAYQPLAYETINVTNNAQGAALFFVSHVYEKIGGFDEKYFLYMEDADITMKVNQVSQSIYFPNIVLTHEWQQNNRSLKGIRIMIQSMFIYYKKWGWKLW